MAGKRMAGRIIMQALAKSLPFWQGRHIFRAEKENMVGLRF